MRVTGVERRARPAAGVLAVAVLLGLSDAGWAAHTAVQAVQYQPGTGYATEFGTGAGYTNAAAALGLPASANEFGPVTPFNAPYALTDLVSVGTGGSLTVAFNEPVRDDPANAYGLDFLIYGSVSFLDAAYPNGQTDATGTTFGSNAGGNPGTTRVWVSADSAAYYELNPSLAPVVDSLFPSDAAGRVGVPVDPALRTGAAFANKSLSEIRALYAGSAGGTGYDLAWAVDAQGRSVPLALIRYVRVEVLAGRSEIDAFVAVPEPGLGLLLVPGLAVALAGSIRRPRGH